MNEQVYFATENKHKFKEAKEILSDFELKQYRKNLPEIRGSLEEIALTSLKFIPESFEELVFVEDSGLFIKSLNGFPGFTSGYVHKKLGNQGILKLMSDEKDRDAYFKSVVAFRDDKGNFETFVGKTEGKIALEEHGEGGFDYDSIFKPEGFTITVAEMTMKEKNKVSHRGKSLRQLRDYLCARGIC